MSCLWEELCVEERTDILKSEINTFSYCLGVAMAAADVSRRRVMSVARRPFSINNPVVPRVYTGSSSTSISARWVLHQVKVHQHPEGESSAAMSRL